MSGVCGRGTKKREAGAGGGWRLVGEGIAGPARHCLGKSCWALPLPHRVHSDATLQVGAPKDVHKVSVQNAHSFV